MAQKRSLGLRQKAIIWAAFIDDIAETVVSSPQEPFGGCLSVGAGRLPAEWHACLPPSLWQVAGGGTLHALFQGDAAGLCQTSFSRAGTKFLFRFLFPATAAAQELLDWDVSHGDKSSAPFLKASQIMEP